MAARILTFCIILYCLSFAVKAQTSTSWKNKKCAVVLTYDDALHGQLNHAVPLLDSLGLKATFYLSAYFPACRERLSDWKKVSKNGHELANHTLFHPCIGQRPGREWVKPERDLQNYTMQQLLDEIRMTNVFLEALDGKTKRTFAYTCGDMTVRDSSFVDQIKGDFVSARSVKREMYTIDNVDLYTIGAYTVNGQSGTELIAWVKEAMNNNKLLVFLFHGVGGDHNLNVDLKAHRELLKFLKAHEKEIWIAPFMSVTEYIKEHNASKK